MLLVSLDWNPSSGPPPKPLTTSSLLFQPLSLRLISRSGLTSLRSTQGQLSSVDFPSFWSLLGHSGPPALGPSSSQPASPGSRGGPGRLGCCPTGGELLRGRGDGAEEASIRTADPCPQWERVSAFYPQVRPHSANQLVSSPGWSRRMTVG